MQTIHCWPISPLPHFSCLSDSHKQSQFLPILAQIQQISVCTAINHCVTSCRANPAVWAHPAKGGVPEPGYTIRPSSWWVAGHRAQPSSGAGHQDESSPLTAELISGPPALPLVWLFSQICCSHAGWKSAALKGTQVSKLSKLFFFFSSSAPFHALPTFLIM